MTCPWCGLVADPGDLHAHLVDAHGEQVTLAESATGMHTYSVRCPLCGASYDRRIKPRVADEAFLAEFDREIRLVALDMLLHHLVAEHEPDEPASDPGTAEEQEAQRWQR
ncbi:MAG: hypothetical protein ACYDB7_06720 [Mycobacteriales bacterium]